MLPCTPSTRGSRGPLFRGQEARPRHVAPSPQRLLHRLAEQSWRGGWRGGRWCRSHGAEADRKRARSHPRSESRSEGSFRLHDSTPADGGQHQGVRSHRVCARACRGQRAETKRMKSSRVGLQGGGSRERTGPRPPPRARQQRRWAGDGGGASLASATPGGSSCSGKRCAHRTDLTGWGRPHGQERRDCEQLGLGGQGLNERAPRSPHPQERAFLMFPRSHPVMPQISLACLPTGCTPLPEHLGGCRERPWQSGPPAARRTARQRLWAGHRSPITQPLLSTGTFSRSIMAFLLKQRRKLIKN